VHACVGLVELLLSLFHSEEIPWVFVYLLFCTSGTS
jgi:hypothetical protein